MKKFDDLSNCSQGNSALAAYSLRRLNIRQNTATSGSIAKSFQSVEISGVASPRPQDSKVSDDWRNAEDTADKTHFWDSDNGSGVISDIKSVTCSGTFGASVLPGCNNSNLSGAAYGNSILTTSQRFQKIVPSDFAPDHYPIPHPYILRPCWPKICSFAENSNYSFSRSNTLPATEIAEGSGFLARPIPYDPCSSSFTERMIHPKSAQTTCDDSLLAEGLPYRFENGENIGWQAQSAAEQDKSHRTVLGSGFFNQKLSFSRHKNIKESKFANRREQSQRSVIFGKSGSNGSVSSKRDALLIWSVPGNKNESKNARNGKSLKSASSRDKPRVPKFFQSFCCCIRPEVGIKGRRGALQPTPSTSNPQSLITQITRNSQSGTTVNGTSVSGKDSYPVDDDETGEYVPMQASDKLLLPPVRPCDGDKKCLIIDLDETLVHSSFKPVKNPDFIIPVEIDNVIHQVYVLKRPYVDEFLEKIGDKFECVLFTASLAKYADPVADFLDKRGVFRARLFRESCVFHKGNYVKDLTKLGRDLKKVIIVDNSPASYAFHPDNAIPVQTWFDDANDAELLDLIPVLEQLAEVDSIYTVLKNSNHDMRRSITSEYTESRMSS